MNVLVCGARGLIGTAICTRLERDGHRVVRGVRHPEDATEIAIDYTTDLSIESWLPRLRNIDVVINAVGIIVERGMQTFERVHSRAPIALFSACQKAGVRQVLQISALGAESEATAYFKSKCAADTFLLTQPIRSQIIRPSLVYGTTGTSARFFRALASTPIHFLPAGGHQTLRPLHIDDLTELVARLLDPTTKMTDGQCITVVGNTQVSYRDMLRIYRASMGLPPARTISLPSWMMHMAAAIGEHIPGAMLTNDTWHMLQRGSTGDAGHTISVLGRAPQDIETFISPQSASTLRNEALTAWRAPLLRGSLSIVWIITALVSAFAYPYAESLALLSRVNLHGLAADIALYGACVLDFGLGVATLAWPGRRLWLAQIALVLAYSVIIGMALPEFLSQPFGPILKNVPILAILILLFSEEENP